MIRRFVRFAVERPILNHILMVFMLIMAIFAYQNAYQNIAKEIFPASTLDEVSISGGYFLRLIRSIRPFKTACLR